MKRMEPQILRRLDLMCILAEISGALVKIFRGRGRKANMGGANFGHKML